MILLLLLSFCGGSSAPVSDDISSETQETPTQSPVNKEIAWGVTTNQPVVYAAADVTQEHIDITCLLYTSPSPRDP